MLPAPLRGAIMMWVLFRWLAPPANFRDPSGVSFESQQETGRLWSSKQMQYDHSAFLGSEFVRIKDAEALEAIRKRCTTDSPLSLHTVFPENMSAYAGQSAQIIRVMYYHMGYVLYELREVHGSLIQGSWPEDAVVDQELLRADENPIFRQAAERYVAKPSSEEGLVDIRDKNERLLCSLRTRDVDQAVKNINRVANLRCCHAFERRYNFEDDLVD